MVQKVHLIIKGMNGDYDLTLYFLLEAHNPCMPLVNANPVADVMMWLSLITRHCCGHWSWSQAPPG